MTSTNEIIRAKAEAVRAMADALTNAVRQGWVSGPNTMVRFVENWAAAVESMVPAPVIDQDQANLEAVMERLAAADLEAMRQTSRPMPY
jgi:hypothetical protein